VASQPAPTRRTESTVTIGESPQATLLPLSAWRCDASDTIAQSALDVSATKAVSLLNGEAPSHVVAAPASPYDWETLVVADAVARWAGCAYSVVDPGFATTKTELQQRAHGKVREFVAKARAS